MDALKHLLDVTLAIFMIGNMLDMGLRLDARKALHDLRDLRFLLASLLWGFVALPALAWGLAFGQVSLITLAGFAVLRWLGRQA